MSATFSDLPLAPALINNLQALGYSVPTPIQQQAIPLLCAGRDLLGLAQTGTGKTASFVLPMLQRLFSKPQPKAGNKPCALILAPTRELAIQIGNSIGEYGAGLERRHAVIYGGVGINPQIQALQRGPDMVVATPGRLLDLVDQGYLHLNEIKYLVLDEADRLLDMGFLPHVRRILGMLPRKRQSMMFSATMPKELESLVREMLIEPAKVQVTPTQLTVTRIRQEVIHLDTASKLAVLKHLLRQDEVRSAIVFTRTKHRANRVANALEADGIGAEAIHGNKSQSARQRALARFKDGEVWVLVATDIAARGLDIDGVTHVFNFELPNEPESYVHRIGRTARAGATGIAIALCDDTERSYLKSIEKLTGERLQVVPAPAVTVAVAVNAAGAQKATGKAATAGTKAITSARRANSAAPAEATAKRKRKRRRKPRTPEPLAHRQRQDADPR